MRILAIRGENLASLAAPFEINLASEPLAGAGLFAITGETGAGKSTILDALCLALYGEYPRVAVGRRESVPDPSGEAISVHDGRAILRRGGGFGYAEVDFIGQDGEGYRARWEANRARGRATGRLQGETRMLHRLDDNSPVATGKTQMRDAIEARTDLTFEQFRRTVLLAQGEFDAFLLAAENERAELLEKITGTEIYAVISMRVHEGTRVRRRVVDQLEQRRSDIGLLGDTDRQAILDQQQTVGLAIHQKTLEIELRKGQLDHFNRVATARADLGVAAARSEAARLAKSAAAPDYEALAEVNLAEPLRAQCDDFERARQGVAETQSRVDELSALVEKTRISDASATADLAAATATDDAAEDLFKRFGPLWSEAERLDAEVATALRELSDATESSGRAENALTVATEVHRDLHEALEAAKTSSEETSAQENKKRPSSLLASRLSDALSLLEKRSKIRNDLAAVTSAHSAAEAMKVQLGDAIGDVSRTLPQDRQRKVDLYRQIDILRLALAEIDEPALQHRDKAAQQAQETLRELGAVVDQHQRALSDRARYETDFGTAAQAQEEAAAVIIQAEADRTRYLTARGEIAPLAELIDEAETPEAIHLRSLLIPETACPVCGSTDHPHLRHPGALNDIVANIRRRREQLDTDLAATDAQLGSAVRSRTAAEVQIAEATRNLNLARNQIAMAEEVYRQKAPMFDPWRVKAGMAEYQVEEPFADSIVALTAVGVALAAERKDVAGPQAEALRLRNEVDGLQRQHDTLATAIDTITKSLGEQQETLYAANIEANTLDLRKAALAQDLLSLDADLTPFLVVSDRTVEDCDTDTAAVADRFTAVAEEYTLLQTRVRELEKSVQELTPKHAAAAVSIEHAQSLMEQMQARVNQRCSAADELKRLRDGLLDGEATGPHRTRINEQRRAAREALTSAREARSGAFAAFQSAEARYNDAVAGLERATVGLALADQVLDESCLRIARPRAAVQAMIGRDILETQELRLRIQEIEKSVNEATIALTTRDDDLARALEGYDETTDAEALNTSIATLNADVADLQQNTGGLAAVLRQDDEAHRIAASLGEEIELANSDLTVWQAVDQAIGSATGDRFRRFAQGITLDHLVQLANDHLQALSPRYRLARRGSSDLTLHVVDRDMGDEIRGTRSLSGGERFLVSLALALALSGLEGRTSFVDTLFIDEGFGSLDADTLDQAVDALETLHGRGQKVGVITHVAAMIERIAVQVRVEKRGSGKSAIRVSNFGAIDTLTQQF